LVAVGEVAALILGLLVGVVELQAEMVERRARGAELDAAHVGLADVDRAELLGVHRLEGDEVVVLGVEQGQLE
jgi:hypothetical protein